MQRKLHRLLASADLREEEIAVYLALLKLRRASASELAAARKLNHMTTYRTLSRLQERGLVKAVPLNAKKKLYEPLSLASLVKALETQERKLRKLELALRGLDRLLPFMDIDDTSHEGDEQILVREGLDAFREEYLRMPQLCEEEYLHIGSMHNYWKAAGMTYECAEERNFIHTRLARGIDCRILNTWSTQAEEIRRNDSLEHRLSKFKDNLPIVENYMGITETHVTQFICDPQNPRAIVIRHPDLVRLHHEHFEQLWNASL